MDDFIGKPFRCEGFDIEAEFGGSAEIGLHNTGTRWVVAEVVVNLNQDPSYVPPPRTPEQIEADIRRHMEKMAKEKKVDELREKVSHWLLSLDRKTREEMDEYLGLEVIVEYEDE